MRMLAPPKVAAQGALLVDLMLSARAQVSERYSAALVSQLGAALAL